jgi:hypothetical protein
LAKHILLDCLSAAAQPHKPVTHCCLVSNNYLLIDLVDVLSLCCHQAIVKQLSGSCQAVVMQLPCSCHSIVMQLSGSCQAVIRQLSGSHQAVVKLSFIAQHMELKDFSVLLFDFH